MKCRVLFEPKTFFPIDIVLMQFGGSGGRRCVVGLHAAIDASCDAHENYGIRTINFTRISGIEGVVSHCF